LKLLLGSSVSRAKVLAGKWVGNFLSLAVPFLLVSLLATTLLMLDPNVRFSSGQIGRLALLLGLSLFYLGFFLSLGMLVSTLTRRAATSVVILLFLWSLFVFIIPNLGTLLARQVVSVPSVRALGEKRHQMWTREVVLSVKDGNWKDHVREISNENDQVEQDYRLKFDHLVRLSRDVNRISPAASFLDASSEIAGTGIGEESRLKDEIIRYKDSIIGQILTNWDIPERSRPPYPAFTHKPRSLAEIFAEGALFDTVWLVFFNIITFAAAFVAFIKYDVR
jgi:ABC-type transport system involved in multi-copper enzyme maturation permease subunit